MLSKLKNKLWNSIYRTVIESTPRKAIVKVAYDSNTYHPPLQNYKCHHNTAWYLKHNSDVVAVAKGFYVDSSNNHPIAHFICLDMWGNWFDPTLPTTYIKDNEFYVVSIYISESEFGHNTADNELMDMKRTMYGTLKGWKKWLCWVDKEHTF